MLALQGHLQTWSAQRSVARAARDQKERASHQHRKCFRESLSIATFGPIIDIDWPPSSQPSSLEKSFSIGSLRLPRSQLDRVHAFVFARPTTDWLPSSQYLPLPMITATGWQAFPLQVVTEVAGCWAVHPLLPCQQRKQPRVATLLVMAHKQYSVQCRLAGADLHSTQRKSYSCSYAFCRYKTGLQIHSAGLACYRQHLLAVGHAWFSTGKIWLQAYCTA